MSNAIGFVGHQSLLRLLSICKAVSTLHNVAYIVQQYY